jgi:hypothetical protein
MAPSGFRFFLIFVALVAAAGCTQTAGPSPAPAPAATSAAAGVTPSTFRLPEGSGCAGEVGRYRAVMENDLETGHVTRAVHDRVVLEIDRAASACSAGRDAEAIRMIHATKAKFGYP